MKIAYITTYNPHDIHAWSGLGWHIQRALQERGAAIENIGGLPRRFLFVTYLKRLYYARVLKQRYEMERDPLIARDYARQAAGRLAESDCDLVFSPGTIPLAYLETEKPMVFWTDATFAGMLDFYPVFTGFCKETIRDGNHLEQLALSKCRLAIYSSEWAARTAVEHYDVDPAKVKVVPFGANIVCRRSEPELLKIIEQKDFTVCRLLFLGVDWRRKGGDVALAAAALLNKQGIKTELHVAGCRPFDAPLPDFVKNHGFISKNTAAGRSRLNELMEKAHFLILPSRAECCAVVFAEASSFGLPSLGTAVGGNATAVRDGKNGVLFPLTEGPQGYCSYIRDIISSREKYTQLALSSFNEYKTRLSWEAASEKVLKLVRER